MDLRTLGGLSLVGAVRPRPKALLLLAYLSIEGPQDRPHLGTLFFGRARDRLGSLRTTLTRLRHDAPGALVERAQRLSTGVTCDAGQLLQCLDSGDLIGGVALYSGPFLAGVHPPDWTEALEDWVYATRETIARRVRGGLLTLSEREAASGDFNAAASLAERACWLKGAPQPDAHEIARLDLLMTAGQSARLGQLRALVRSGSLDWSVGEAQRTLATHLTPRPSASAAQAVLVARSSGLDASNRPPEVGHLTIGTNGFLNHPLLPQALRRYARRYPQAGLSIRELFSSAQLDALARGALDVGLVTLPVEVPDIAWEWLWREAYVALLPASHPLARQREVPLTALADEPFILHPRALNPPLYDHVLSLLRSNGIAPPRLIEGAVPQTRNHLVAGGFGFTLALPSWPAELSGLVRRPIRYTAPQRPMVMDGAIAWHRTQLSAPGSAFVEILRELTRAGVAGTPLDRGEPPAEHR